jgi:hypothetical protein
VVGGDELSCPYEAVSREPMQAVVFGVATVYVELLSIGNGMADVGYV